MEYFGDLAKEAIENSMKLNKLAKIDIIKDAFEKKDHQELFQDVMSTPISNKKRPSHEL